MIDPRAPLVGKVAEVIDKHLVAINRGERDGVEFGDLFDIGMIVIDPETGESLGSLPGLHVKVFDVQERFCLAETFRHVCDPGKRYFVVNIGDEVRRIGRAL